MSAKKAHNKNTRKAAMEIERLSWETLRFTDDGRQWQHLAQIRRAYLVKAANAADPDGTHVEIAVPTFTKAAGKGRTAYRLLDDLKQLGALLPFSILTHVESCAKSCHAFREPAFAGYAGSIWKQRSNSLIWASHFWVTPDSPKYSSVNFKSRT